MFLDSSKGKRRQYQRFMTSSTKSHYLPTSSGESISKSDYVLVGGACLSVFQRVGSVIESFDDALHFNAPSALSQFLATHAFMPLSLTLVAINSRLNHLATTINEYLESSFVFVQDLISSLQASASVYLCRQGQFSSHLSKCACG